MVGVGVGVGVGLRVGIRVAVWVVEVGLAVGFKGRGIWGRGRCRVGVGDEIRLVGERVRLGRGRCSGRCRGKGRGS